MKLEREVREKEAEAVNSNLDILRDKIIELEHRNRELEMRLILSSEKDKATQERLL